VKGPVSHEIVSSCDSDRVDRIDDSKIYTARSTTITARATNPAKKSASELRDRGIGAARRRANAKTLGDRLNRTDYRTNHRVRRSYTPKVFEEAPAEGDRPPPSVADPARCTESFAACYLSPRSLAMHDIHRTIAGGMVMQSPQVFAVGEDEAWTDLSVNAMMSIARISLNSSRKLEWIGKHFIINRSDFSRIDAFNFPDNYLLVVRISIESWLHGKNGFAEVCQRKFHLDTDLKIMLDRQNNYIGRSSWLLECQNFLQHYHHAVSYNYFDGDYLFNVIIIRCASS